MKNKIQKLIVAMITVITVSVPSAHARESYAGRGAWIGAIAGGVALGGLTTAKIGNFGNDCPSDTTEPSVLCDTGSKVFIAGIATVGGAVIGAGLGALFGLTIPKHKNISIAPTFDPTPGAVGGGVNLSLNF